MSDEESEILYIDDNDEYYVDEPNKLLESQDRVIKNKVAHRKEDLAMRSPKFNFASPKNMLPNVLRSFARLLMCTSPSNLFEMPEDLTNKDMLGLLNLQYKAASTLIKHIVPTLKATANLHGELDSEIEAHLMGKSEEQLKAELLDMDAKLGTPKGLIQKTTQKAADVLNTWECMRRITPEEAPAKSGQRKVKDAESRGVDRDAPDLQSGAEEEAGSGSEETVDRKPD
jgi:hypothetical protein